MREGSLPDPGIALHKLATLHEALGQAAEAAHYFQQNLLRIDAAREQGSHRQDALLFLATFKKVRTCLAAASCASRNMFTVILWCGWLSHQCGVLALLSLQLQLCRVLLRAGWHVVSATLVCWEVGKGVCCVSQDSGELAEAEAHCLRLLDVGGATKDKAKALLREIRSLQQQRGSARSQPAYGAPEV